MSSTEIDRQYRRIRKSWPGLSRQDKTIALKRLEELHTGASSVAGAGALSEQISQLHENIRLALGMEPTEMSNQKSP